jgi:hypothetical protein
MPDGQFEPMRLTRQGTIEQIRVGLHFLSPKFPRLSTPFAGIVTDAS